VRWDTLREGKREEARGNTEKHGAVG